jgi:hypothetical protein
MFYPQRRKRRPTEGPLSKHSLRELSLFSSVIFIFSALLMQFLQCAWLMILLNYFDIHFSYGLFHLSFFSESGAKWSEEMIMLVFGSGPLLMSIGGVALLLIMKNLSMTGWKTKLVLTWMCFLMVNAFPCSILAGTMLYDGFGVAYMWMLNSLVSRGILALLVLVVLVITSRFWYFQFLKTVFTLAFFKSPEAQRSYFLAVFLRPWILGVVILMTFNWPFTNLFWPAFLISLGYMAIILVDDPVIRFQPRIRKSDKQIFTSRIRILSVAVALLLIWAAGNIRVRF